MNSTVLTMLVILLFVIVAMWWIRCSRVDRINQRAAGRQYVRDRLNCGVTLDELESEAVDSDPFDKGMLEEIAYRRNKQEVT